MVNTAAGPGRNDMATLRDVARLAGVSAMTVSNVINGREGRVSAATVEKVRAAVEEIG